MPSEDYLEVKNATFNKNIINIEGGFAGGTLTLGKDYSTEYKEFLFTFSHPEEETSEQLTINLTDEEIQNPEFEKRFRLEENFIWYTKLNIESNDKIIYEADIDYRITIIDCSDFERSMKETYYRDTAKKVAGYILFFLIIIGIIWFFVHKKRSKKSKKRRKRKAKNK